VGSLWEYDAQHNSLITAGNGGTKPLQAAFTIYYNQGTKKYELEQTLQPDEQMWIDVGKLIREHAADKNGNTLPADLTSGSYEFRDLTNKGVGNLFEGKVVYDKTFGQVTYGCGGCCGYTSPKLWYDPLGIPFGQTSANGVEALNNCYSSWDDVSDSFYGAWNTANTSIATADHYGTHTGHAVGSTSSTTGGELQSVKLPSCPLLWRIPQGGDNVGPVITSINPNLLNAGDTGKSVTIHGAGFGSSPQVKLPSGVSMNGQQDSASDNTIVLPSVSVLATAYIGPNSVTVTANGQTSNPSPFTIDGPDHLLVQDDVIGSCSGCHTTVERDMTYQVIKFSGSPVFVIPIGEVLSTSGWNCKQSNPGFHSTPCAQGEDTDTNGEFIDGWTLSSDAYTPPGCGENVADHWQWCTAPKTIGSPTGYCRTDQININGSVRPPGPGLTGTPIYP